MNAGDRLTLTVEKPAAGGRMIARHQGAVVLVSGAIPGETVEAHVEKIQRGTAWARTVRVIDASGDRVEVEGDWSCGGNVLAHVSYPRQLSLKREIVRDALARIGRMSPPAEIDVMASPPTGYRMRARLHVVDGRIGFFREGTHHLCAAESAGQLLDETIDVVRALQPLLRVGAATAVHEIEISENRGADQRAIHLTLRDATDPSRLRGLPPLANVRGMSCGPNPGERPLVIWGSPEVTDTIALNGNGGEFTFTLARHAHAFFQGNRHLLAPLVAAVIDEVPEGNALDLYAGVGLFSVALAARGANTVIAIEGDRVSASDLETNAVPFGAALEARHQSVEAFLRAKRVPRLETVIVDPPRTGMTKGALQGAVSLNARRIVYVSCDVATFARDARVIVDSGYRLTLVRAFDLFPQTAHVETLAVFERESPAGAAA